MVVASFVTVLVHNTWTVMKSMSSQYQYVMSKRPYYIRMHRIRIQEVC